MSSLPETVVIAVVALLLIALAFIVLAALTVIIFIRQRIIIPKFRNQFLALHQRRVARARLALAGNTDGNDQGDPPPALLTHAHAFSGWIDLRPDGTIAVGGQTFHPGEAFEATARGDTNNIPLAKAAGNGKGEVRVVSLGQSYRAKFTGTEWDVQLLEEGES